MLNLVSRVLPEILILSIKEREPTPCYQQICGHASAQTSRQCPHLGEAFPTKACGHSSVQGERSFALKCYVRLFQSYLDYFGYKCWSCVCAE